MKYDENEFKSEKAYAIDNEQKGYNENVYSPDPQQDSSKLTNEQKLDYLRRLIKEVDQKLESNDASKVLAKKDDSSN